MPDRRNSRPQEKKTYTVPVLVDFGAIEAMTGDSWGSCLDGPYGGRTEGA